MENKIKNSSLEKIKRRLQKGMYVWRGVNTQPKNEVYNSDPGDLGRGIYYTTSNTRACAYGVVHKYKVRFKNPLVLSVEDAYELADSFHTIRLTPQQEVTVRLSSTDPTERIKLRMELRLNNSHKMTEAMLEQGHDGLAAISHLRDEIEIVNYKPYEGRCDH